MSRVIKVTKWGNSCGIRIPAAILKEAEISMNDLVYIESEQIGAVTITKKPAPEKGTIEYLFKDYSGEVFDTELVDLGDSVGKEKW